MRYDPGKAVGVAVLGKAVVMTVVAVAVTTSFIDSLILVVVSATLTGLFTVLVSRMTIQENRRLHDRLDDLEKNQVDIGGAVGLGKRSTDSFSDPLHKRCDD